MVDKEFISQVREKSALLFSCLFVLVINIILNLLFLYRNLFKPLVHFLRASLVKAR